MKKISVGAKVTVTKETPAYYSGYTGNPVCIIKPGIIGTVKANDIPYVSKKGTFSCVDFEVPGVFNGDPKHNNTTWRIGVPQNYLKEVEV